MNEIKSFEDENGQKHDHTKIAYSPQWIGGINLKIRPVKGVTLAFVNKFVGKQYLDNTTNENLSLKRYNQSDIRLSYVTHTDIIKDIEISFLLNNFTNRNIVSNAYVYAGEAYYFPQAKINFLLGLNLRF